MIDAISGKEWFEKTDKKSEDQQRIKRGSATVFKCDITGKIFEGSDAQKDYNEHMKTLDWNNIPIDIETIKNPKTMSCILEEVDDIKPIKEEKSKENMSTKEIVDSLLNGTYDEGGNEAQIKVIYICTVCEAKSKYLKDDLIQFNFEDLGSYDTHLWEVHSLSVNREGEKISVENVKTGEKIEV